MDRADLPGPDPKDAGNPGIHDLVGPPGPGSEGALPGPPPTSAAARPVPPPPSAEAGEFASSGDPDPLDTTVHRAGPATPGRAARACAVLVVLNGPEIGNQFPLRRSRYTIGRAPDADIPIRTDGQISRYHACLSVEFDEETRNQRYRLTDLGSLNHTIVNGDPITDALLQDRDKIQVGDTTLRFAILDEVDARFHSAIQKRLRFDRLTGLLTRESADLALDAELHRAAQRGQPLSILMMDIDHFRAVNEGYGHQAGSAVLAQLGALLERRLRGFDLVGRFGGEEFIVGLPETDPGQAHAIAERLRQAIADERFGWQGATIAITISIGIAASPTHGYDLVELVKKADQALYRSKHAGRNRVSTWETGMGDRAGTTRAA